jgi:nicotinate-nucleotide adenylyltransferase
MARAAAEEFGLDRVLFVPTGHPPHRQDPPDASYEDRFAMAELSCRGENRFEVSRLEAPTPSDEPHYSVDTVHRVREECQPADELFFLIGADAFAEITQWRRWKEIVEMVELIVVSRPGEDLPPVPAGARARWLTNVHVPISSTEIRERLSSGQPVTEWLAPGVEVYIRERGLYQQAQPAHRKSCY